MAEEENREEERDRPHFSLSIVSGKVIGSYNVGLHITYVKTIIELEIFLNPYFCIGLNRFELRSGLNKDMSLRCYLTQAGEDSRASTNSYRKGALSVAWLVSWGRLCHSKKRGTLENHIETIRSS